MGYINVDAMLRNMTLDQFREWQAFEELEPFLTDRISVLIASVIQALVSMKRDPAVHPEWFPRRDFLITFGDEEKPQAIVPPLQSWQQQKQILEAYFGPRETVA